MTHTSTQRLFNETALNKMPQGVIFQALARRTISWYPTKADLLAETGGYAGDENTPAAGEWVTNDWVATRDGYVYQVAASSASDHDEITAGGVKLYEKSLSAALLDARLTAAEGDISALEGSVAAFEGSPSYPDFAAMEASNAALDDDTIVQAAGASYIADSGASTPTLTNAGGSKLVILNRLPRVAPEAFGYDFGGTIGEKTAWMQKWSRSGLLLDLPEGGYETAGTLGGAYPLNIVGRGPDSQIIGAVGTYDKAVLECSGTTTALPNLASTVNRFDMVLPFMSAHGLVKGDDLFIANRNDFSYSAHGAQYRAGEACRVVEVIDTTNVILEKPLFDTYVAADVDVLKLNARAPHIENLTIIAPGAGNDYLHSLKVDLTSGARIYGVQCRGSGATGVQFTRSVRGQAQDLHSEIYDTGITGFEYAVAFKGCQDWTLSGNFYSQRHAVTTTSASTYDSTVVNRNIRVHDSTIASTYLYAADSHGATEYLTYDNCDITGGVSFRGDYGSLINSRVRSSEYQRGESIRACVSLDELTGPNFTISNCYLQSNAEYAQHTRAMIACITGAGLSADLKRGGVMKLSDIKFDNPVTDRMVWIRNMGATEDIVINADNLDFGISTQVSNQFRVQVVSGSNFQRVIATNIQDPSNNLLDITGADEIIGSPQSGKSTVSWTTSDNQKAVVIVFPKPFPAVPSIVASIIQAQDNGQGSTGLVVQPIAISATQTTLRVCTADGSNFAAAGTNVPVHWMAMLG